MSFNSSLYRGIDIDSISTVIHYDVARAIDTFVHRSGRTARNRLKPICLKKFENSTKNYPIAPYRCSLFITLGLWVMARK